MTKDEQNDMLDAAAGIFLRCFVLAVCLLLLWFVFFLVGADWAYGIHSRWFGLSRLHFDLMIYYGLAFFKMAAILFFLLPYVSIRLILRKRR
ncbi:MAG TPA: hypothetical protein VMW16_09615 [Sedimentisphaerales bacterium]|nr:hypothetical protein [Sedimentisphaerales bacterium]